MTISRTPTVAPRAPEGLSARPVRTPLDEEPLTRGAVLPGFQVFADEDTLIRRATGEDGAAMFDLVRDTGSLDVNSPYAYLMMGHWFADSSVVAERDGEIVGFIVGFVPPRQPDTVFVWQVGVAPSEKGRGLGKKMIDALLDLPGPQGRRPRYLEATVTPSNTASEMLFRGTAKRHEASIRISELFPGEWFPASQGGADTHEPERLFRIGPLASAS
ncbi:diaminobutyrate acetyltransferase [Caenispirillum salinarum]